jgi:hypothetical protein
MRRKVAGARGLLTCKMRASSGVRKIDGQGKGPVDAIGGRPKGLAKEVTFGGVGFVGPYNRLAIAARDDEESLADGGGSVITSAQFAPFDDVGKFAELPYPAFECFAFKPGVGLAIFETRPITEFLDVFKYDDARFDKSGPFESYPS